MFRKSPSVALVAGFGPSIRNGDYLAGTHFRADSVDRRLTDRNGAEFALADLTFATGDGIHRVLRPRRGVIPHLTTVTIESILAGCGVDDVTVLDTDLVWRNSAPEGGVSADVVLLSTTYMWTFEQLRSAVDWIGRNVEHRFLVLGGQYSNLKSMVIMSTLPAVSAVIKGDAEHALPMLMTILRDTGELRGGGIPNAVWRSPDGRVRNNPLEYVDITSLPGPVVSGSWPTMPYESMRGCPFDCSFCSFPAASPKWRYRDADTVYRDWMRYTEQNGTQLIKALDSTFTVPPTRLRELIRRLPGSGIRWEGYSRANSVTSPQLVEDLIEAGCVRLQIGFESMSDNSLNYMSKRVRAKHNWAAFEALADSGLGYTCFFMTGYPGETPEDFKETSDFLLGHYRGHFMLSVFSLTDETMPVWGDAERFSIKAVDPSDPTAPWSHVGMDSATATELQRSTLDKVRRDRDDAVLLLWQGEFQHWLLPHLTRRQNLRAEKLIERLAFLPKDLGSETEIRGRSLELLGELHELGIVPRPGVPVTDMPTGPSLPAEGIVG
jgi:radical SAM superfamily enzyme YgiQ (UPF0313 family)